jgi:hypothetical protein
MTAGRSPSVSAARLRKFTGVNSTRDGDAFMVELPFVRMRADTPERARAARMPVAAGTANGRRKVADSAVD